MSDEADKGAIEEAPACKPCCRRLTYGRWCLLPDGHDGDCHGVASAEWPWPAPDFTARRKR